LKWSKDNIPSCEYLLQKMKISKSYREYRVSWFATIDITHQTIFPRKSGEIEEGPELVLEIEKMIAEVDPESPTLGEYSASPFLPSYIFENYERELLPSTVRLLHFAIDCDQTHDGDCTQSCPRDSSMITSKSAIDRNNRNIIVYPDMRILSNPRFALFQTSEGHILGILTFSYLK
jgi:hypothetical protein